MAIDFATTGKHDHTRQQQLSRAAKVAVDWWILNLDTLQLIQPQLPMPSDGIDVTYGGNLVDQARFGEQDPVTHWVHGVTRSILFKAVLFTRHADEAADVQDLLEQIILLTQKDPKLGRPPICQFTYGSFFNETVLIETAGTNIVSVDNVGRPREVQIAFTLRRYVPFSQKQIDPTKPTKESFYLIATEAERSYEALARRFYGDPLLAEALRRRHPAEPFAPRIGSKVKIPPRAIALREPIDPQFHALSLIDEDAVDNFELILADRSSRKVVEIV
jgi:hypothetical protein